MWEMISGQWCFQEYGGNLPPSPIALVTNIPFGFALNIPPMSAPIYHVVSLVTLIFLLVISIYNTFL